MESINTWGRRIINLITYWMPVWVNKRNQGKIWEIRNQSDLYGEKGERGVGDKKAKKKKAQYRY